MLGQCRADGCVLGRVYPLGCGSPDILGCASGDVDGGASLDFSVCRCGHGLRSGVDGRADGGGCAVTGFAVWAAADVIVFATVGTVIAFVTATVGTRISLAHSHPGKMFGDFVYKEV